MIDKKTKNLWQNEQHIMINQILIIVIRKGETDKNFKLQLTIIIYNSMK